MKKLFTVFLAACLVSGAAFASFEEDLQRLASENATNYISPFVTAFGTNMNTGLYHTAAIHKLFGFDVGIHMMGAIIPDDAMTYTFALPPTLSVFDPTTSTTLTLNSADIYPTGNRQAPTIFGSDEETVIAPDAALVEAELLAQGVDPLVAPALADSIVQYGTFPMVPGLNLEIAPLAMPQFSLGLPFKTEVLLRYMPTYTSDDFGDIDFLGIGVKHSISQYIPACPVDIAVQYVYQSLTIGELLESKHTAMSVLASKKLSLILFSLTPYVGLGMESSNLKVDYTIEGTGNPLIDGTPVSFDIDGDNGFRGKVGLSTRILLFKVYADYAFIGDYGAYTAGLVLSIR